MKADCSCLEVHWFKTEYEVNFYICNYFASPTKVAHPVSQPVRDPNKPLNRLILWFSQSCGWPWDFAGAAWCRTVCMLVLCGFLLRSLWGETKDTSPAHLPQWLFSFWLSSGVRLRSRSLLELLWNAEWSAQRATRGPTVITFLSLSFCYQFSAWPCQLERDHDSAQWVTPNVPSLLPPVLSWPWSLHVCLPFPLTRPHLVLDDLHQLHRLSVGLLSSIQLLRRAAGAPDLLRDLRECAGVRGGVSGARPADHHQLPHRLAGRVGPAAGHAGHALGRVPGGVFMPLCCFYSWCFWGVSGLTFLFLFVSKKVKNTSSADAVWI